MSIFSGPAGRGAMRQHRENKRLEAADRRAARDHKAVAATPAGELLTEIFGEHSDNEQEERS